MVDGLLGTDELRHWIDDEGGSGSGDDTSGGSEDDGSEDVGREGGLEALDEAWAPGHLAFLDAVEGDLLYEGALRPSAGTVPT